MGSKGGRGRWYVVTWSQRDFPSPSIAREPSGKILTEPTEAVGGAVRAETQTEGRPWRIAIRIESDGGAALGMADGSFHSASLHWRTPSSGAPRKTLLSMNCGTSVELWCARMMTGVG